MASIISAGTTSGTSLNLSGDTSGVLQLASNGSTTAVTIDTNQRAAFVAGTAALPSITTTGDTNTGIFFPAADTMAFAEGGTEVMRIDSSGRVITPFQPAFSAFNSVDFSTGQATITYDSTALNIGSNYSTSTGRFTAPVAGCYIFFHRLTTSNNIAFETIIEINGSQVARSYVIATGSIRTITTTAICSLSVSDYAQPSVYVPSSTTFNAGSQLQSNFHGYFLG